MKILFTDTGPDTFVQLEDGSGVGINSSKYEQFCKLWHPPYDKPLPADGVVELGVFPAFPADAEMQQLVADSYNRVLGEGV